MWGQIFSLAQLKGSLALELGIVKIMYVSSTLMLAALFWRLAPIQHQLKKKRYHLKMQEVQIHNAVMYLFTQNCMHRGKKYATQAEQWTCATQYDNVIC